ncbi:hypothetical protein [Pelodictyon luteolum]|uniref:Uncharacterized protein n=1 Tax=Chlorobium luteolum (strain DSM 273 / BCRC 81028 / 2530) TaxID=319225 RepID=Q3B5C2_CHLL3|nr:hypothetical protein [Pelodictyon luteolum]ABB23459.1 conserved hypothetical protein [Pelodictyon luteolum DSM 273]
MGAERAPTPGSRRQKFLSAVPAAILILPVLLSLRGDALGWHDRTHVAIARAAGFERWYSAAAPDVAKSKYPCGAYEGKNHYFHNPENRQVTGGMVQRQISLHDRADDQEGHLYGAIVASVREYRALRARGKFADYPMVYCPHYAGDLSMPLHNVAYDAFNRARHHANDGVIEESAFRDAALLRSRIYPIRIGNEDELCLEIARIAELSRQLALRMQREGRDMTRTEALGQAVHSASLLQAILIYAGCPVLDLPESALELP